MKTTMKPCRFCDGLQDSLGYCILCGKDNNPMTIINEPGQYDYIPGKHPRNHVRHAHARRFYGNHKMYSAHLAIAPIDSPYTRYKIHLHQPTPHPRIHNIDGSITISYSKPFVIYDVKRPIDQRPDYMHPYAIMDALALIYADLDSPAITCRYYTQDEQIQMIADVMKLIARIEPIPDNVIQWGIVKG